jgi:hypothetical protein
VDNQDDPPITPSLVREIEESCRKARSKRGESLPKPYSGKCFNAIGMEDFSLLDKTQPPFPPRSLLDPLSYNKQQRIFDTFDKIESMIWWVHKK